MGSNSRYENSRFMVQESWKACPYSELPFFGYAHQSNPHPILYYGRFHQLVGEVNKGNSKPTLPFYQNIQQLVLIYAISLTYLTFDTITLYCPLERRFETLIRMEASASSSSTGKYTTRNGKTENEREPPANIFSIIFFLSSLSTLCKVFAMSKLQIMNSINHELWVTIIKNELQGLRHLSTAPVARYFYCYDYKPQAGRLITYNS